MCTDFPKDVIWINTMCAVSLANHLRAVADAFRPLRTLRGELPSNRYIYIYIYQEPGMGFVQEYRNIATNVNFHYIPEAEKNNDQIFQ